MLVTSPHAARPVRFVIVGVLGFVLQVGVLALLVNRAGWHWLPATALAVELAIVHNYWWHRAWTWRDRRGSLVRFNLSTALTSIAGNLAVMALLVGVLEVPVVAANVIAVGLASALNFLLADRWVFIAMLLTLWFPSTASAAPRAGTLLAWQQYVERSEATIAAARAAGTVPLAPEGTTTDIGGGTVSHWRGSVFVAGVTLAEVLHRLQHPGTPPPQEDVTAARVLARGPDSLRVYIRLVRHAVVTVTYDTEHEMTFHRESAVRATARSVATRIEEVGGGDKGFLWRLNSYWQYVETNGGVLARVESLTLSRDVPFLVKPLVGRLVPRIARESIDRTLGALKRYLESPAGA